LQAVDELAHRGADLVRRILLDVVDIRTATSRWFAHASANASARPTRIAPGSADISSFGTWLVAGHRPYPSTVAVP
jgi:hypothetical protein